MPGVATGSGQVSVSVLQRRVFVRRAVAQLSQVEHGGQGIVDTPHLFGRQMASEVTETAGINGTDLLDEDSGRVASDVDLGTE